MLPGEIALANLLPWDVDAPDFRTGNTGPTDVFPSTETAAEIAAFERFLDDRFPRDKFPEFRHAIDGPRLLYSVAAPPSKLFNYHYIVEARRQWRAAARKSRLIALLSNDRLPLLRICEWRQCQKLFVAGRNNQRWCSDKCGAANRMEQMRAKAKEYELNRQRKKAAKEYGAAQKRQRKGR
jgi:CGNR zinc finger